ncbi:MAG: hypothetical protein IJZ19_15170 [Lentisphaeria bacterium]|nr:hypothetical protein [Lentisphaeria bacterium]
MYANWKIDTILEILKEAGRIALAESSHLSPELKPDHSIVTAADRKIEEMLAAHFDRPGCGSYMIGEESVESKSEEELSRALQSSCCYIVDPIDGTAPYAIGLPVWGCSIGLMEHGVLTEGAIYQPVPDVACITCRGTVWVAKGLQTDAPEVLPLETVKLPWSPAYPLAISSKAAKKWQLKFKNQVFAWACCVGDYAAVLSGKMLGCFHAAKLWDIAGGFPLLKNVGFVLRYQDGSDFDFNIVRSGAFFLTPGERRWYHAKTIVIAPDEDIAEKIWNGITVAEEE